MYRISSTINLEDIVFVRKAAIGRDPILHETPPSTTLRETAARKHSPTPRSLGQTGIKVGLIWCHGMQFGLLLHSCHDSRPCNIQLKSLGLLWMPHEFL